MPPVCGPSLPAAGSYALHNHEHSTFPPAACGRTAGNTNTRDTSPIASLLALLRCNANVNSGGMFVSQRRNQWKLQETRAVVKMYLLVANLP